MVRLAVGGVPHSPVEPTMTPTVAPPGHEIVDFSQIPGVPCPCGTARRAFYEAADFPGTVHRTEISADAQVHYHKKQTEVYYFLDCGPEAKMELDGKAVPVRSGMCILIRPGVRHRAVGKMTVLIVCVPKFDEKDEWFD
jgi:mannose-6-phosphate isomerase-like protein (cupin superfamily)